MEFNSGFKGLKHEALHKLQEDSVNIIQSLAGRLSNATI